MNFTAEAQREAAFQEYINSENTKRAIEKIEATGGVPWFEDPERRLHLGIAAAEPIEARRELFMRRYTRPAPPSAAVKVQR